MGQADGDVAATGADIGDLRRLQLEAVQNLECFFDDEFRFGTRNEDRRCDGEIDAPELPDADDVGRRLTGDATRDPLREHRLERRWRFATALGKQPHTIPPEDGTGEQRHIDRGFSRRDSGGDELCACPGQLLVQGECVVSQ